jgi:hypothetical protein
MIFTRGTLALEARRATTWRPVTELLQGGARRAWSVWIPFLLARLGLPFAIPSHHSGSHKT